MFKEYLVVVVRRDGFLFKRMFKPDAKKKVCVKRHHWYSRRGHRMVDVEKKIENFVHHEHRYHFSPDDAFLLKRYIVKRIDWRSPLASLEWLIVSRAKRGMLVYREPKGMPNWDYKTAQEIPIEPLKGDLTPEMLEAETVHGSIIDPMTFKKLALSPVFRRLINKTRFGTPNILVYLLAGGVIAVILLILMTQVF